MTGYTPEVKQDNEISFCEKVKVTWSRSAPDEPVQGRVISAPEGELGRVTDYGYRSKDTIAIQYSNNRTGNDALFKLLDGNDKVTGFPERKNVFLIGNDYKLMTGGNKDDQFVLRGNQTKGELSGLQGSDILFTNYFASNNSPLFVTFSKGNSRILHDNSATCRRYKANGIRVDLPNPQLNIQVNNINQFYGRSNKVDYVSITCDSGINFVDLLGTDDTSQGVISPSSLDNIYETNDRIYIEQNRETNCSYDMNLAIHPSTIVENRGSNGNFTYKVKSGKGSTTLSLDELSTHKLLFEEVKLTDIRRINVSKENNLYQISLVFNIHNNSKRDANTGLVITQNKHKDFQLHINSKELFNLNLELSDGTLIDLVEKRIYVIKPLEELGESTPTLVDLSSMARNMARRLGFAISARSDLLKTYFSIGNGESNLMYNNVKGYTSYLVGNGGNDTYVITSGYNKLDNNTEIPDVIISDIDVNKNDVATLVLSGVMDQIRNDLNIKVKSVIQRDSNDLLIVLKSDEKDLLEVRLLNALNNDVYKKYEVILNDLRMKISKISSDYVFEILPIAYDSISALQNIKKVYSEDIENIKELKILDRSMDDYTFIREEDSLVISNIFSQDEKQYGMILVDFFLEDQFKDLSIKFKNDKKISLKDHLSDIYNAQDIDKIKAQYDARIYSNIDLYSAIKKNNLNKIVSLLEQGANFDLKDDYGKTSLDVARETILDSSGKIQGDVLGRKLIYLAAESGNVKAIEYLLNKGEDVNIIDNFGWRPLHYAAKEGKLEAVKYLIDEKKLVSIAQSMKLMMVNLQYTLHPSIDKKMLSTFLSQKKELELIGKTVTACGYLDIEVTALPHYTGL
ncbi:MAG: ankyrin repeat domain-containing protein [Wolbachia endosymbiont of Fragariocoptes setiger]|nr:ankyrin repeat domain-containing protein [Wolbachia endosymbiont of Fragariocoptes setiger]